jgi:cytochrome c-type biogenesis protein CcmH/NrfF
MDEFWWSLMTIVGPIILLVLLIWVVVRSQRRKGEASPDVTERATRQEYSEEEQMRREGTDDR